VLSCRGIDASSRGLLMRVRVSWSLLWKVTVGIGVLAQIASWAENSRFLPRVPGWARVMLEAISGYLPGVAVLCIFVLLSMGLSRLQRLGRTRERELEVIRQDNDRAMKAQCAGEYETLRKNLEANSVHATEAINAFHATSGKRLDTIEKTVEGVSGSIKQHVPSIGTELEARLKALEARMTASGEKEERPQQARRRHFIEEGEDLVDAVAMDRFDTDSFARLGEWVNKAGPYLDEIMPNTDWRGNTSSLQEEAKLIIAILKTGHTS
jgi:hypothetical protein